MGVEDGSAFLPLTGVRAIQLTDTRNKTMHFWEKIDRRKVIHVHILTAFLCCVPFTLEERQCVHLYTAGKQQSQSWSHLLLRD